MYNRTLSDSVAPPRQTAAVRATLASANQQRAHGRGTDGITSTHAQAVRPPRCCSATTTSHEMAAAATTQRSCGHDSTRPVSDTSHEVLALTLARERRRVSAPAWPRDLQFARSEFASGAKSARRSGFPPARAARLAGSAPTSPCGHGCRARAEGNANAVSATAPNPNRVYGAMTPSGLGTVLVSVT
jgi:hypothetical protein